MADLKALIQVCQTISSKLEMDALLAYVLQTLLSQIQADRALILLLEKDGLLIAVQITADSPKLTFIPFTKIEKPIQVIINRIIGTRETIVLPDADRNLVGVPLLHEKKMVGICYLELTQLNVDKRIVLEVLLQQTAVSLHNARRHLDGQDQIRQQQGEKASLALLQQKFAERTIELEATVQQLKATQDQLIVQENLASLGSLASGIAHEIKNPLNFVNNFAAMSIELVQELRQIVEAQEEHLGLEASEDIIDILSNLEFNADKIREQGQRADSIVRSMLLHSRGKSGQREASDINTLLEDAMTLAYHGARTANIDCEVTVQTKFADDLPLIEVVPQDLSRVFLNILSNAYYAVQEKQRDLGHNYEPKIIIQTLDLSEIIEIRIRDNGTGIAEPALDKVFTPFYTTKPAGEGTGLGLSLSYNIIVQGHQGRMSVQTEPEKFTEFIIQLPK
jgi:signal transduction histidine kinase